MKKAKGLFCFGVLVFMMCQQVSAGTLMGAKVNYQVEIRSDNPEPPSCETIAGRLRVHEAKIDQMSVYTNKISRGKQLSFKEILDLESLSRKYLPQILDPIDQKVRLKVSWIGKDSVPAWGSQFSVSELEGPALRWVSLSGEYPDYIIFEGSNSVSLSYNIPMLAFCFSDNQILVKSRKAGSVATENLLLSAKWVRDARLSIQKGSWVLQNTVSSKIAKRGSKHEKK